MENIALVAKQYGVKVIHLSTDFVFDGASTIPYDEESEPHPLSVYGETKLKGEQLLQVRWGVAHLAHLLALLGIWFQLREDDAPADARAGALTVVDDQRYPTYATDLAEMMIHILQQSEANGWTNGLFHFSNRGQTSWYGRRCDQRMAGIENCKLVPVTTAEYPTAARRPAYSVMDLTKISDRFRVEIPTWEEALQRCLQKILQTES